MTAQIRPRKPLLALLMSLVLPGFGQLYNGDVNRAIWLWLASTVLTLPLVAGVALTLATPWMMPLFVLILLGTLGVWVYGMVDAWRSARRKAVYMLPAWQTSGLYALTFILGSLVALPALSGYIREKKVESFRIPAVSMEPTLMHGDLVFADKRYNCPSCKTAVARGDIVIFTFPNDRTFYFAKRVIGLPGERITVKGRRVSVNDRPLTISAGSGVGGERVEEGDGTHRWRVVWLVDERQWPDGEYVVPAGQVFVMGDNRNVSEDSRMFGTVPLQDVVGKVRQVWLSVAEQGVRWDRIGKPVSD